MSPRTHRQAIDSIGDYIIYGLADRFSSDTGPNNRRSEDQNTQHYSQYYVRTTPFALQPRSQTAFYIFHNAYNIPPPITFYALAFSAYPASVASSVSVSSSVSVASSVSAAPRPSVAHSVTHQLYARESDRILSTILILDHAVFK